MPQKIYSNCHKSQDKSICPIELYYFVYQTQWDSYSVPMSIMINNFLYLGALALTGFYQADHSIAEDVCIHLSGMNSDNILLV